MTQVVVNNITSGYNLSKFNNNFTNLSLWANNVALSNAGGNNVMHQDFDMNSNDILNANSISTQALMINGSAVVPSNLGSFAPNSVGTIQVIDGSITNSKLALNSVFDTNIVGPISSTKTPFIQAGSGAITRTLQNKGRERITPEDFGAVGDGVTDDTPAFLLAIAAVGTIGRIYLGPKTYFCNASLIIPQGVNIEFVGDNSGNTNINFSSVAVTSGGFRYVRSTGTGASSSTLTLRSLVLQEVGFAKTPGGAGIFWWGFDKTFHDNYLFCHDITFRGFDTATWTRFVGQAKWFNCTSAFCNIVHKMDRDASFHTFKDCLSLSNAQWIYGDDSQGLPVGDQRANGVSNTVIIDGCIAVNSTDNDITLNGWQAVYIAKGGCDGGTASTGCAINLINCYDFTINGMYISSANPANSRHGLELDDCLRGNIAGNTFVNTDIGLLISGPSASSVPAIGNVGTKVVIDGNFFMNNRLNDILGTGNFRTSKIINNHFDSTVSRTGTNFELYITDSTNTNNVVQFNTFKNASYTITSGAGSIIGNNIFGAV